MAGGGDDASTESGDPGEDPRVAGEVGVQEALTNAAEAGKAKRKQISAQQLADFQALASTMIASGAQAAAKEFEQSKNAGRALQAAGAEQIRVLANQAAGDLAISGAKAAGRAFSNAGGFPLGIPAAAATIAFYTALAGAVSVAGGAAAKAIAPPSGGGPATAAGAQVAGTEPVLGAAAASQPTIGAAQGLGGDRGPRVVVNVTSLTGSIDPESLERLTDAIRRAERL